MWNTTPLPPFLDVILAEFPSKLTENAKFWPYFSFYPIMVLLGEFLIFSPKNGFSSQKVQKYWKSKNGVKTALTPLFKDLWAVFSFVKFKNQISPQKNRKSFDDLQIFDRKSGHFLRDFRRILDILLYWCLLKFNFWFFPQKTHFQDKKFKKTESPKMVSKRL